MWCGSFRVNDQLANPVKLCRTGSGTGWRPADAAMQDGAGGQPARQAPTQSADARCARRLPGHGDRSGLPRKRACCRARGSAPRPCPGGRGLARSPPRRYRRGWSAHAAPWMPAQVRTSALTVSLVAAVGVILLGVLPRIIVVIVLAILSFFRRNSRPHGAVLGEVPEIGVWYGTAKHPGAPSSQGLSCSVGKRRSSLPTVVSSGIGSGGWHANGPCLDRSAVRGGH